MIQTKILQPTGVDALAVGGDIVKMIRRIQELPVSVSGLSPKHATGPVPAVLRGSQEVMTHTTMSQVNVNGTPLRCELHMSGKDNIRVHLELQRKMTPPKACAVETLVKPNSPLTLEVHPVVEVK